MGEEKMADIDGGNRRHNVEAFTCSSEPLRAFIKQEGLTHREAADLFGCSATGISGWINKGRMPKMLLTALEGIKRRRRAEHSVNKVFLVSPRDKATALELVLKSMDVEYLELTDLVK